MIIPVRCFTCGKVLADKWEDYAKMCTELEKYPPPTAPATTTQTVGGDGSSTSAAAAAAASADADKQQPGTAAGSAGLAGSAVERPGPDGKTARGRIMDELGIVSYCCRTHMMTHVDLSMVI